MKSKILAIVLILLFTSTIFAQNTNQKIVKNVIIMIPDDTSIGALTLTRWYNNNKPLAIDPLICGLVKTNSSDSTIADSAPAGSAYATGFKSKSGYVGIDADKTPRLNIMELAKMQGKATGIVVTCESQHATPADFSAHVVTRRDYFSISEQQIYSGLNIVMCGGANDCIDAIEPHNNYRAKEKLIDTLKKRFTFIQTKYEFNKLDNSFQDTWCSFGDKQFGLPNDKDRDTTKIPSLAQMTAKAINKLANAPNGFVLMVEGSKVDWAAHANDPVGVLSELSAFDKAVQEAIKFAKENKNTVVIVCPDHGNGGISIGNDSTSYFSKSNNYESSKIYQLAINNLSKAKYTAEVVSDTIIKLSNANALTTENTCEIMKSMYGTAITTSEASEILKLANNPKKGKSENISYLIGRMISSRAFIGWTTHGHTGEDVFLGVYHPQNYTLHGIVENTDIFNYMCEVMGVDREKINNEDYFCPMHRLFSAEAYDITLSDKYLTDKEITAIRKSDKKMYIFQNNTNKLTIKTGNSTQNITLKTVVVGIGEEYYLPKKEMAGY